MTIAAANAAVERAKAQYKRRGRRALGELIEAYERQHAAYVNSRPPSRWSWEMEA